MKKLFKNILIINLGFSIIYFIILEFDIIYSKHLLRSENFTLLLTLFFLELFEIYKYIYINNNLRRIYKVMNVEFSLFVMLFSYACMILIFDSSFKIIIWIILLLIITSKVIYEINIIKNKVKNEILIKDYFIVRIFPVISFSTKIILKEIGL